MFRRKKKKSDAAETTDAVVTPSDVEDDESEEFNPAELSDEEFRDYMSAMRNGESYPRGEEPEDDLIDEEPDDTSEDEESDEEPAPPYKTFTTEAEYKAEVDKAIAEAKKQWDLENQTVKARHDRMEKIARGFFPDNENGFDALSDELEGQLAEREGVSLDDYRNRSEVHSKAEKWDNLNKMKSDSESRQKAIVDKWVADAGNLKVLYPDFDLAEALRNEDFTQVLRDGGDVFSAYAKAYNGSANPEPEETEPEPEEEKREEIPQNGRSKRRGTGSSVKSVESMSSKEFKEYIDKIKNS